MSEIDLVVQDEDEQDPKAQSLKAILDSLKIEEIEHISKIANPNS